VTVTRPFRRTRVSGASLVVIGIAVVIVGLPLWVVVVNSFKPYADTVSPGLTLPVTWRAIENYRTVLSQASVERGFLNSGIVLLGTIPPTLVLSAAAAWVFARSRSRALRPLYYVLLVGVVVPPAIVASVFVFKALGIYGGLPGLAILYCAWFIPLGIFLVAGFVRTLPVELEEAARIDGASSLTVFVRIVLPLLFPVLITTAIIIVIGLWNDFLTPFMMLRDPRNNTLTLSLLDFAIGSTVGDSYQWNLVFADIVLSTVPMFAAYYVAQRYVTYGLAGVGK
jgi:raffinose/stachyose/melibiose transport system permease protein